MIDVTYSPANIGPTFHMYSDEKKRIGVLNVYMDRQKLPPNLEARTAEK
jgi:hypothetical protein